jgi:hypothetical protein
MTPGLWALGKTSCDMGDGRILTRGRECMKIASALFTVIWTIVCPCAFAEQNAWLETGGRLSIYRLAYGSEGTQFSSSASTIDLMLAAYRFVPNSGLGWFLHSGFGMPISGTIMQDPAVTPVDQNSYIWLLRIESIGGPALRLKMGANAWLVFGCGLAVKFGFGDHRDIDVGGQITHSVSNHVSSGIGGDIGLVFYLFDNLVLKIGSSFAYYFLDHRYALVKGIFLPIHSNYYSELGLSPYLGIDIDWEEIAGLGKAKSTTD